jgi:hypothetical protein
LGERLLCKQEVVGSIPSGSTSTAVLSIAISSVRKNKFARRLPHKAPARVLSDIVKRRSFRATQVTLVTCDRAYSRCFRVGDFLRKQEFET